MRTSQSSRARLALLLSVALSASGSASACAIKESSLIGDWEQKSKIADYAVMAFDQDGNERVFDSWRHNRPDVSQGAWKLENCQLTIWADPDDVNRRAEYIVLEATAGRLRLRDSAGRESSYRKIRAPARNQSAGN